MLGQVSAFAIALYESLSFTALNPDGDETWNWEEVQKYIKKVSF